MTNDTLMTVEDDDEEGIEKFSLAAEAVEQAIAYFRRRTWSMLPFNERRRHAETMRFLSSRIARAAERLRDADRELRLAIEVERDYTAELSRLRQSMTALEKNSVLMRKQA